MSDDADDWNRTTGETLVKAATIPLDGEDYQFEMHEYERFGESYGQVRISAPPADAAGTMPTLMDLELNHDRMDGLGFDDPDMLVSLCQGMGVPPSEVAESLLEAGCRLHPDLSDDPAAIWAEEE